MTGLDRAFREAGAAAWGAVDYVRLTPLMAEEAQRRAEALCPRPRTVLAAAFPYYAGDRPGNLSLYARGEDYHRVLPRRLKTVCDFLLKEYPEDSFYPSADSSPLPEREAAWLAGIGWRGKNGLLLLPPHGTYVFLGTILTSAEIPRLRVLPARDCHGCNCCVAACPTGALKGGAVDPARCLSALSQRKGDLSPAEEALLAAQPLIWGCDACQRACRFNEGLPITSLPEFREDLVDSLSAADLEGLTNRAFQARYGDRAFAWRGPAVLRRNLALKDRNE